MGVAIEQQYLRTRDKDNNLVHTVASTATSKDGALTGFWLIGYDSKTGKFRKYTLDELRAEI